MRNNAIVALLFVGFIIICGVLAYGCAQLPNPNTGTRYLSALGFEHIRYVSRAPFAEIHGCSDKDVVVFKYTALNPRNQPVTVEVCQGWPFGGAHLRGQ